MVKIKKGPYRWLKFGKLDVAHFADGGIETQGRGKTCSESPRVLSSVFPPCLKPHEAPVGFSVRAYSFGLDQESSSNHINMVSTLIMIWPLLTPLVAALGTFLS